MCVNISFFHAGTGEIRSARCKCDESVMHVNKVTAAVSEAV